MLWKLLKKNRRTLAYANGLFFQNPLLMLGMFLAPVVVAVVSLKTAVALVLMLTLMTLPTCAILSLVGNRVPSFLRAPLTPVLASVWFIPAYFITQAIFPQPVQQLGLYLPLVVLDMFFVTRCANYAPETPVGWTLLDAFFCLLGIGIPTCVAGLLRELLGSGTIWGRSTGWMTGHTAVYLPFMGFFLVALLGACLRFLCRHLRSGLKRYITYHEMEEKLQHD